MVFVNEAWNNTGDIIASWSRTGRNVCIGKGDLTL